jgi:type IV pilus assembly protein PilV
MRANQDDATSGLYNIALEGAPEGGTMSGDDLVVWKNTLAATLPSGDGAIAQAGSIFTITVEWDDSKGVNDPIQYQMETQL